MKGINRNLVNYLREKGVDDITPSVLYLLSIYFNLNSKHTPLSESEFKIISKFIHIKSGSLTVNEEDLFENETSNLQDEVDLIIEQNIERYRNIFDGLFTGSKGTLSAVKKKMKRFLVETEYTIEELIDAAEYAVRNKGKYAGQADYFMYKRNKDGTETTRAINILEELNKQNDFIKII